MGSDIMTWIIIILFITSWINWPRSNNKLEKIKVKSTLTEKISSNLPGGLQFHEKLLLRKVIIISFNCSFAKFMIISYLLIIPSQSHHHILLKAADLHWSSKISKSLIARAHAINYDESLTNLNILLQAKRRCWWYHASRSLSLLPTRPH